MNATDERPEAAATGGDPANEPRRQVARAAARSEDLRPPSPAELAGEIAELGLMATSWWLGGVERGVSRGLAGPARAASGLLAGFAGDSRRLATSVSQGPASSAAGDGGRPATLRERGAELLRRSADVHEIEDQHPAYRRILGELAPDEARILRLLATRGAEPVVDVRRGIPPATRLVEADLTMIATDAGCRRPERSRAYLDNLRRLGLIVVSRDSISDPMRYQLLEAQPEVVAALEAAGRTARTDRRSVELTSFGRDFCRVCLPIETGAEGTTHPPAPAGG